MAAPLLKAGAIRHWSNPSLCSHLFSPPGYIHWRLRWANVLHFYALFQKQSWVALSHFWKTYTLYLFAICDTDLQSACHIFGRLTGAEIWLQDQTGGKCRCGGEIKTQSDIFCKHRQNRLQLFPTKKPKETFQELDRDNVSVLHQNEGGIGTVSYTHLTLPTNREV